MNLSEYKYDSVLNSYELTQQQYYDILAESTIIEDERCVESHCCGPHWFSTIIKNNDTVYTLNWAFGLYWEKTEKNPDGTVYTLKPEHKWSPQI